MININKFKSKTISFVLSSTILGTMVSCSNNIEERLSRKGINIEVINEYQDNNLYKMNSFDTDVINEFDRNNFIINNTPSVDYSLLCTPIEFGNFTNEYNISYDDIRNTISNIDIDTNIKNLLLKGINNLEKNEFNMNLEVLNYNLKRLKIIYSDELVEEMNQAVAKFEPEDGLVTISSDAFESPGFEEIFFHEVLGHGMTIAYIPEKDLLCSTCFTTCIIEDNKYKGNYVVGRALDEALAEIIRKYAANTKIDNEETFYTPCVYSLLILLKSNNISIEEYANNGVEYLMEKLKENNLGRQIDYIKNLDKKLLYMSFCDLDIEYSLNDMVLGYLYEVVDNNINNGKSIDEIKENINKIINSYDKYIKPYKYNDTNVISMISTDVGDYIVIEDIKTYINEYIDAYRYCR